MKEGTKNLTVSDLHYMETNPDNRANAIGSIPPYHLQYIRDGKPVVKPEGENERILRKQ